MKDALALIVSRTKAGMVASRVGRLVSYPRPLSSSDSSLSCRRSCAPVLYARDPPATATGLRAEAAPWAGDAARSCSTRRNSGILFDATMEAMALHSSLALAA
uniref:Uncharacterized protein n=1 Tax=Oryza nivara TaxID=4536 RepID=A0A0E0GD80_ORYNI